MTIARSSSLTIEDFDFDIDLATISQRTARIVESARKAEGTGSVFVLARDDAKCVLNAIDVANTYEKGFGGYKSLLVHLWFIGGGCAAIDKSSGTSFLEGCLNVDAATIKRLQFTGRIRWQCHIQGLPLDLFSDSAVNSLGSLLGDPDELRRNYHEIVDGYLEDRERIKRERKEEKSLFPKSLPKYVTNARVKKCILPSLPGGSHSLGDTKKSDSQDPVRPMSGEAIVDQDDDPNDPNDDRIDARIDDRQRVLLLLGDAEVAVEALAGRFPKHSGVAALGSAISRVYEQANDIRLSATERRSLWSSLR